MCGLPMVACWNVSQSFPLLVKQQSRAEITVIAVRISEDKMIGPIFVPGSRLLRPVHLVLQQKSFLRNNI
jgi:hypothetical protein